MSIATPAPAPLRLHPNLADLYRRTVTELPLTLADPAIALPARETIRGLIEAVTVSFDGNQPVVALDGALASLNSLAQNDKSPGGAGLDGGILASSAKVVAGAGFEPAAFRL